jgi:hypothetical protein
MTQEGKHVPNKHKALSSNPSIHFYHPNPFEGYDTLPKLTLAYYRRSAAKVCDFCLGEVKGPEQNLQ